MSTTCMHCDRAIVLIDGAWIDPEATGDDSVWRETCDSHDTFTAEHEPAQHFVVVCPDGQRRHAEPFATHDEAEAFADYGHACMAAHLHTVLVLPVDPFEGLS